MFVIALIGFAIACPGITFFLLWFFTRPLVIGAIIVFVVISIILAFTTDDKQNRKDMPNNKPKSKLYLEKEDWCKNLSKSHNEKDNGDELHKEM